MMAKCFIATLCVLAAGAGSLLILVRGNNSIFCVRGISDAEVVSSHDHTLAFQKLFKKKPQTHNIFFASSYAHVYQQSICCHQATYILKFY